VAFVDPHLPLVLAISAPVGAPVAASAGLAGKTVGVQEDTFSHSQVKTITGVAKIRTYSTILRAFSDLADGHIEAVVNDEIVSTYILDNKADLKAKVANSGRITTTTG
jgi:ABC-type amino acid transport substrate-binding protein